MELNKDRRSARRQKLCDFMKNETLKEISQNYPNEIMLNNIDDFENFDERLSVIDCIVVNTIGVEEDILNLLQTIIHR